MKSVQIILISKTVLIKNLNRVLSPELFEPLLIIPLCWRYVMSDFLKNLRSSHKKISSDPKRNLDGHYYPKNERRQIPDRRSTHTESLDALFEGIIEILPKIADNSSVLSLFLDKISEKSDKLVEAKIRQHNAVSTFFENLNLMLNHADQSFSEPAAKASASYASGTRYTKDEILETMRILREKGATFAQIADYLKQKGMPTFSGKGQWHAQTIHRLCRKMM